MHGGRTIIAAMTCLSRFELALRPRPRINRHRHLLHLMEDCSVYIRPLFEITEYAQLIYLMRTSYLDP